MPLAACARIIVLLAPLASGVLLVACRPASAPPPEARQSTPAPAPGSTPASSAASSRDGVYAVATIRDLMEGLIDPSADAIWESVQIEATLAGTRRKAPESDDEWRAVRRHALTIAEAANLLLVPDRAVARANAAKPAEESVDLPPAAVAALIAKDRAGWTERARGLQEAAVAALTAADARDVNALLAAGETLDTACEACHAAFWYPSPR